MEKHSVSRLSYLFAHLHLLSSDLFSSDSSHLCFSTVHIVGSFTSKLPSITVSFPDRFRTAHFSFLLKYENECVHGRILLLVLLLYHCNAATTTTPRNFCLCFSPLDKSSTEGSEISQKPVRNLSETGQARVSSSGSGVAVVAALVVILKVVATLVEGSANERIRFHI